MSEQVRRPPGRPRKWASEAERKRAYRQRRAAELAGPAQLRAELQRARSEAKSARSAAERAHQQAERWKERAGRTELRVEKARQRIAAADQTVRRAQAERDEASRTLRGRLRSASDIRPLLRDPDRLVVLVDELRSELKDCQRDLVLARKLLGYPAGRPLRDPPARRW